MKENYNQQSRWQEGANAARQGILLKECPYPIPVDPGVYGDDEKYRAAMRERQSWLNGYKFIHSQPQKT